MKKLRIIFMGTPDFAVGILKCVLDAGYEIAAVVTAADKPAGRGQKIKYSAVKEFAVENGLNILQPVNLKAPEFLEELKSFNANLQIVVAFRMLPESVWRMPEFGTFNLHASLLPQYRGAAPINWAIINGEKTTGVTTFFIDDKIDTGEIITSDQIDIGDDETAGELHDRLMVLGGATVLKTLKLIATGDVKTQPQPESDPKTAFKLNRENCRIDWNKPAKEVHDHIRGLSPYPAAWTLIQSGGQEFNVKIFESKLISAQKGTAAGQISVTKKEITIACLDSAILVTKLQFPGKKPMTASELLNGFNFAENSIAVS